ncbi:hypothetical protein B0T17DRAFT_652973 [Bombardia bombarda]|uniref:Uncharacterized protein n=1 Tax=Bombardia bombarda TaxID=252184 RepID=A0AA39X8K2_9PEZI|nr:hypothetical protein B0T17DRAFT_652973 [Bombardia bombarda]
MAQLLAPYNNSMRLGQGFNSYIQQICLDRAVLPADEFKTSSLSSIATPSSSGLIERGGATEGEDVDESEDYVEAERKKIMGTKGGRTRPVEERPPWVKAQIVTYSSRFVDKLSDVTDAMNISGSLSIKTGTIGGQANGSYVDSDKFKSSDINFHLQVKVTNQIHDAKNYTVFNKIEDMKDEDFPQIYGDTFISGWEEGGELNAIISIKVSDKAKITEIKAGLEANMTTPAGVSIGVKGNFEMDKRNITKDTETTMAVNWSGGGSIKDPSEEWSIATLKRAAAAFPDLVAITPQRTYAILTKYTALESFHQQMKKCRPLDYENAGIYTGALLDHYMDYKVLWKQISQATYELEANHATIEMAQPSQDICDLAEIRVQPTDADVKLITGQTGEAASSTGSHHPPEESGAMVVTKQDLALTTQTHSGNVAGARYKYTVFHPSFAGLIKARKVCRFEMSKIVKEVDIIAKHPQLASDAGRDSFFLHPLVFRQMLPIVRIATEGSALGQKDPYAATILGYSPPNEHERQAVSVHKLDVPVESTHVDIQQSLQEVGRKSHDYRVQGFGGEVASVHSRATLQNDLKRLDPMFRPTQLAVWFVVDVVKGIQVRYANGEVIRHGSCDGSPSHSLQLDSDGSEIIYEVVFQTALDENNASVISQFSVATSRCKTLDTTSEPNPVTPPPKSEPKNKSDDDTEAEEVEEDKEEEPSPPPPEPRTLTNHKTYTWSRPNHDDQWSLRGFVTVVFNGLPTTLGVVWGKDAFVPVPSARIAPPLCKDFLGLSPALKDNIRGWSLPRPNGFPGKFLMGHSISTGVASTAPVTVFNALDAIDFSWKVKSIGFAAVEGGKLAGIKVVYFSGRELVHGAYLPATEVWSCSVKSDLVVAKITAGKKEGAAQGHVNSLEFIRADERGSLPQWPLEISTLRYVAEDANGEGVVLKEKSEVVDLAPTVANVKWSVRGFYGEVSGGLISRLGVIWGRG